MLNSFDKGTSAAGRTDASFPLNARSAAPQADFEKSLTPAQGVLSRLFVRRRLILLFSVIIFSLSVFYGLPWQAEALALLAFALGVALIPRTGGSVPLVVPMSPSSESEVWRAFETLINALPEPAVLLTQDGTIHSFNDQAHDLFEGLKPGSHISAATRNPRVLDAIRQCALDKTLQTVNFSDRVPVERHMAATVSNFGPGQKNTDPSLLLFLRDLTEQRRLDQLRSDFIANASHEIKTPLASLLGYIETLQGAARHDEAARERFLSIMARQAERMARLIEDLMALSRVEMRAHLKPQGVVMICEIVRQSCDALEPMAAEANINVTVHCEPGDVAVLGDRDELATVFLNLVHNAIKYGRRGGSVSVCVERKQNGSRPMVTIVVEDDGPGISSQYLPRLTERFYRVPDSPALEKGGTGLGLAIVKHVINRHRGEFRYSSKEGAGSCFTVLLAEHTASASDPLQACGAK